MDQDLNINDLLVPLLMVACYALLMSIFLVAKRYYPSLNTKKESVQRLALVISFMALPLLLIFWGTFLGKPTF